MDIEEKRKRLILITIGVILYFFANIQRVAIPGAIFDLLQKDLQLTTPNVTALGAFFMYTYAICQLVVGVLTDRYGGARIITFGSIFFCLGSLLFPLSDNVLSLYTSRMLVGLGASTIYLSLVKEIKQSFSAKNFGLVLSIALLVGYMGGIFANAPFVFFVKKFGWRESLLSIATLTFGFVFLFVLIYFFTKKQPTDSSIKLNLTPFKIVLANRKNYSIYLFSGINYGMYYVLQTVIGMKFLQDFCLISVEKSAIVLSSMAALYAVSGSLWAFLRNAFYTRKVIFLKAIACSTLTIFTVISILLILDIKNVYLISALLMILASCASLSPLLVPLLYDINDKHVSATAVSIMTCCFYIFVGLLASLTGFLLNIFPAEILATGINRYSNYSYLLIFGFFILLSLISLANALKIKESKKTERLISIKHLHVG